MAALTGPELKALALLTEKGSMTSESLQSALNTESNHVTILTRLLTRMRCGFLFSPKPENFQRVMRSLEIQDTVESWTETPPDHEPQQWYRASQHGYDVVRSTRE